MEETVNSIVTLVDENDQNVRFDLLLAFDYEKHRYIALMPIDKVDDVGEDEVIILESVREDGKESYKPLENEVLLEEVFNEFVRLFDEKLDEEDEADEKE